jgi:CheY-like chemotaxis protein
MESLFILNMNSVLIIDDDEVDYMIYSRVIKLGKFSDVISYKSSGEAALEYLESISKNPEKWPAYIFVDINMPGIDGFKFIEEYSKHYLSVFPGTKVYMISSSDDFRDVERANSLSAIKGFITKPLTVPIAKEIFK